jgi:putative nucleotidyltransferase with HDIG domain
MSERKRILFVDDEKKILDGLRRMLRTMRDEWEMVFATSGEEALASLEATVCDVIVSDMRMPGMSGEQLLAEVRRRHPGVIRLVLSGQADKDSILKSVGPIHQFLQKPCEAETLISAISRTTRLGDLLEQPALRALVSELESLPSLPARQQDLLAKLQSPNVSPKVVGESIGQDIGMVTKILQLVNSAFFGLRRRVSSPTDAVVLLGMDTVRSLVLTLQVFSQIAEGEVDGLSTDRLLAHSVAVAAVAKKIALAEGLAAEKAEEVYLAGLLHDVGKLVMATKRPAEFAEARTLATTSGEAEEEAERRVFGAAHSEIGAYLLGLWGFGSDVVDAALLHHRPSVGGASEFSATTAVHVANALARGLPTAGDAQCAGLDQEHLQRLGLSDRVDAWRDSSPAAA